MRILNEQELLKADVRKAIIDEIKGPENQARKAEAFKRYQCLKDLTSAYVIDELTKQFDQSTVQEMSYAISNISLVRKCIEKLAKVYSYGVQRQIVMDKKTKKQDALTDQLEDLCIQLDLNKQMKQANKYLKLQRNCAIYIKPCPTETGWDIKVEPLSPYLYDVVEDYYDRTKPMAFILSDYKVKTVQYTTQDAATANRTTSTLPVGINKGDNSDQKIADTPSDAEMADKEEFIWWTNSFHFTTNAKGEIISNAESIDNMIKELPFVNLAQDQDGQFWAIGGSDLVDGAILINSVMTHNQHIATTQGYGQFYMKGKNLPRNIKVGPSKAIIMEYNEEDPSPEIGYATSSPQIDSLRGLVEQYIALLLTTNNLSTSAVASSLSGSMTAPSGVAMMIDKAESIEDVAEQREVFAKAEPKILKKILKFKSAIGNDLRPELKSVKLDESAAEYLACKFNEAPSIQSEAEKLGNLKLRKELGLNTMLDLIMKDNPEMTRIEAEMKLKEILEEKIKSAMHSDSESPEDSGAQESSEYKDDTESTETPEDTSTQNKIGSGQDSMPATDIQRQALNGAQVSSLIELVSAVALGQMPRDSAIEIVQLAFQTDAATAESLLASAGKGFEPKEQNSNENNSNYGKEIGDKLDA